MDFQNNIVVNPTSLGTTTDKVADEHWNTKLTRTIKGYGQIIEKGWIPPSKGWIKMNFDTALCNGTACIAWIARNSRGAVVAAFARAYPSISVDEAEAKAVLEALECGEKPKIPKLTIESDSANIISNIMLNNADQDRLTKHIMLIINAICIARNDIMFKKIQKPPNLRW